MGPRTDFTVKELSPSTWRDFEKLAIKQGHCWCMYYQRPRPIRGKISTAERGVMNRKAKETLVNQGLSHAIIVYDGKPPGKRQCKRSVQQCSWLRRVDQPGAGASGGT